MFVYISIGALIVPLKLLMSLICLISFLQVVPLDAYGGIVVLYYKRRNGYMKEICIYQKGEFWNHGYYEVIFKAIRYSLNELLL